MPESPIAAVPLLDLKAQFAGVKDEIMARVARVFEEQAFILGAHVAECREGPGRPPGSQARHRGQQRTDALILALMALGVGPGDAVVTSPFTFFATGAASCAWVPGRSSPTSNPTPTTWTPPGGQLLAKWTLPSQAKVLLPVHLFGQPACGPPAGAGRNHRLYLLEDAAQAIGAVYPTPRAGGSPSARRAPAGCFSSSPARILGAAGAPAAGDHNDDALAEKLRSHAHPRQQPREKYLHLSVGGQLPAGCPAGWRW